MANKSNKYYHRDKIAKINSHLQTNYKPLRLKYFNLISTLLIFGYLLSMKFDERALMIVISYI